MEQQPLPEDIPVYEIVDSSEETEVDDQIGKYPQILLRRSSRNAGPPVFYGKRLFKDIHCRSSRINSEPCGD